MRRLGFVDCTVQAKQGVAVAFFDLFEVSLDCVTCRRRWRTVFFLAPGDNGACTPTKHLYAGMYLRRRTVEPGRTVFEFEYEYEPFRDAKYPDELRYTGSEAGAPTWARVNFELRCNACGASTTTSTQTNLVRPYTSHCACGSALYEDTAAPVVGWSLKA